MSRWTHAICEACWHEVMGDQCCRCGKPTDAGIYIRANPIGMEYCAHD